MCTGFSVYCSRPIYGFNFDYNEEVELKFAIETANNISAFTFSYSTGGFYVKNTWMNSSGMFSCFNMLPDDNSEVIQQSHEILLPGMVFSNSLINTATTIQDATRILDGKRYAILRKPKGHQMLADKFGEAIIIEEGANYNEIIYMVNDFMVITNFKNSDFNGANYKNVHGFGADRYITAVDNILQNRDNFYITEAFETLKQTSSWKDDFKTLVSMVFNPNDLEIYIVLKRNFDSVWKVSLEKGIIEHQSELSQSTVLEMDSIGITSTEMLNYV